MNDVHLTRHGARRMQQRSVPPLVVDWLLKFGVRRPAGDGAERVELDRHGRRELARAVGTWIYSRVEAKLDTYLVLGGDGAVVTLGHRTRKARK